MKTFALVVVSLFALAALPLASADYSSPTICTPPTVPAGTCASATVGSTYLFYPEPHVGETYSYKCDPFKLVCVLTPDAYTTWGYLSVPWVYVTLSPWCTICAAIGTFESEPIDPILLA